jgi:hypothetical protein
LAESKPYVIAIYTCVIVGGVAYFLGSFISSMSISAGIALEIAGLFLCPNISVLVIMGPKLLGIKGFRSSKIIFGDANIMESDIEVRTKLKDSVRTPVMDPPVDEGRSDLYLRRDGEGASVPDHERVFNRSVRSGSVFPSPIDFVDSCLAIPINLNSHILLVDSDSSGVRQDNKWGDGSHFAEVSDI